MVTTPADGSAADGATVLLCDGITEVCALTDIGWARAQVKKQKRHADNDCQLCSCTEPDSSSRPVIQVCIQIFRLS
jgi:hypothetical protein